MGSTTLWSIFRKFRIVIYVLSALLSLVWTGFLFYYLKQEWDVYNTYQRAIVLGMTIADGLTGLMLYLMLAVKFVLWLDALRIMVLLLIQIGLTILFTLFNSSFPCIGFGSQLTCREITLYAIIGNFALIGLLLIHFLFLSIMAFAGPAPSLLAPEELNSAFESENDSKTSLSYSGSKRSVTSLEKGTRWNRQSQLTVASFFPRESPAKPTRSNPASYSPQDTSWVMGQQIMEAQDGFRAAYQRGYTPNTPLSAENESVYSDVSQSVYVRPPFINAFRDPIPQGGSAASTETSVSSPGTITGRGYGMSPIRQPARAMTTDSTPPEYTPSVSTITRPKYAMPEPGPYSRPGRASPLIALGPNGIPNRAQTSTPGARSIHSSSASVHLSDHRSNSPGPRSLYPARPRTPARSASVTSIATSGYSAGSSRRDPDTPAIPSRPTTPFDPGQWRRNVLKAATDRRV